jgi:hypothetical protein
MKSIGLSTIVLSLLCLVAALPACSPRYTISDISTRARKIHTIGILRPQVSIYQLSAGGQREMIEEWSAQGRNNVLAAAVTALSKRKTSLSIIELDTDTADELDDVLPLAAAIGDSIVGRSLPGSPPFDRRPKQLDYSVGPLDRIDARHKVDALLVMTGYDEISTYGRRALIAVGKITGILFGSPPPKGATILTMELLDRDGSVLWFSDLSDQGGYDLRSRDSCERAVQKVLADFPEAIR